MFSEETLSENLRALERAQGHRPAFGPLQPDKRAVADAATGMRLEVRATDGEWVPVDGPDPGTHADAQLREAGDADDVLLVGPGLGFLLDAVERAGTATRVVAIEPDPGVAVLLLARRDWRSWFESGRLRLLVGPDYVGASETGRIVSGARRPATLANLTLAASPSRDMEQALLVAARISSEAEANLNARQRFAGRYLLQTLQNIPVIEREADARALDGAFAGRPAVIVAAGPSLDRAVATLAPLQNRAVIIAADTVLRPLLAAGVRPHIVVAVDPAEINARHLANVRGTEGIWLAAEGSLHPSAFGSFSGRTFVFKVSNHEPWRWLRTVGVERGTLRAWGSVSTSAFDLALRMGCDPIVFVGHDFAYTDDRPYCDNTVFHEEWRAYLRTQPGTIKHYEDLMMKGRPVVSATDINGARTDTAAHLIAFRNWIVEQTTLTTQRTFINATGAGILAGPRIAQLSLDAALREHAGLRLAVRPVLAALHARSAGIPAAARAACAELADAFDLPPAREVVVKWFDFAAGSIDREAIRAALTTQPVSA